MIPMITLLAILACTVPMVVLGASCDNACSGHGTCGQNGVCTCFDNWGVGLGRLSGDCSERICPFEFAWVDTPDKLGNHHKYAECSNRGVCDRDTGECECFPGYEGKACARTTCPNDCSGHGRCKAIQDLPYRQTPMQFEDGSYLAQKAYTFANSYYKWDADKTRGCVCDPEYGDVDCSKRMCMYGNDVMDQRNDLTMARRYHTQHILFTADVPNGVTADPFASKTIALTFTSKLNETFTTMPICSIVTLAGSLICLRMSSLLWSLSQTKLSMMSPSKVTSTRQAAMALPLIAAAAAYSQATSVIPPMQTNIRTLSTLTSHSLVIMYKGSKIYSQ